MLVFVGGEGGDRCCWMEEMRFRETTVAIAYRKAKD